MTSANIVKIEKAKKLKGLLTFAKALPDRISRTPSDALLLNGLNSHIENLPLASASTSGEQEKLDKLGTDLWNLSTRLNREESSSTGQLPCLLRVFSFLLLDSAQPESKCGAQSALRLLNVALKTAKVCLDKAQLDLCTKSLERAARYEEELSKIATKEGQEDRTAYEKLGAEYLILRAALSWKQSRLDIAEHMFAKSEQALAQLDAETAERLSEVLLEIGKDQLHRKQYKLAVKWLERSVNILSAQEMDTLSDDAGGMKLAVLQSLVRALMGLNTPDTTKRAWDIVGLLEADFEDKMIVSLLKLELLTASTEPDHRVYYSVLNKMIRSAVLTDANFKLVMHHIHRIKRLDEAATCRLLDDFLTMRLFSTEHVEWVEKALITRLWISVKSKEDAVRSIYNLLDMVLQGLGGPLRGPATHAAQTLIWKRVEEHYSNNQYNEAENWCGFACHGLFKNAGQSNKAKIARKMVLCALARHDHAAARQIFFEMSETAKAMPMTRYLMYKVALGINDVELAAESLDIICQQSTKDATLLYACVLEAQQAGNRRQAVIALRRVLEKYDFAAPSAVHLPTLLRCTARLLATELTADTSLNPDASLELCKVFEGAATQATTAKRKAATQDNPSAFSSEELDWFSRNAYNLSLKHCTDFHPEHLSRLLDVCITFIDLLLADKNRPQDNDGSLELRCLFCHYLATSALIVLARSEDNIELSLQYYLDARKHAKEFRTQLPARLASEQLSIGAREDLTSKHFEIVKFELEACLKLESWDTMPALFDECFKYENERYYETLADLVLVIHAELAEKGKEAGSLRSKLLTVLQEIINRTWRASTSRGANDVALLARWLRCLFHLSLPFDDTLSLHCLDTAVKVAQQYRAVSGSTYPTEELEWLATTSFNRAVDFYCAGDDGSCRIWAEKALGLAKEATNGEGLYRVLMEKYSGLTWGRE